MKKAKNQTEWAYSIVCSEVGFQSHAHFWCFVRRREPLQPLPTLPSGHRQGRGRVDQTPHSRQMVPLTSSPLLCNSLASPTLSHLQPSRLSNSPSPPPQLSSTCLSPYLSKRNSFPFSNPHTQHSLPHRRCLRVQPCEHPHQPASTRGGRCATRWPPPWTRQGQRPWAGPAIADTCVDLRASLFVHT